MSQACDKNVTLSRLKKFSVGGRITSLGIIMTAVVFCYIVIAYILYINYQLITCVFTECLNSCPVCWRDNVISAHHNRHHVEIVTEDIFSESISFVHHFREKNRSRVEDEKHRGWRAEAKYFGRK